MQRLSRFAFTYILLAFAVACTTANPRYGRDASVDGPGSGACTANEALRCEGMNLVRCNADGTGEINQSCFAGCNAEQKLCRAKFSDANILWRRNNGQVSVWLLDYTVQGGDFVAGTDLGIQDVAWTIRGTGDFDGDGHGDVVLQNTDGQIQIWLMNNGGKAGSAVGPNPGSGWAVQGIGDFDGDGRADILWRNGNGPLAISFRGTNLNDVSAPVDPGWEVKGVGDFDGDAHSDILWRHTDGRVAIWFMSGSSPVRASAPGGAGPGASWAMQGVGDFDGDSRDDILWRDSTTPFALKIWFAGDQAAEGPWANNDHSMVTDSTFKVEAIGDFNHDGSADILWRNGNTISIWFLAGASFIRQSALTQPVPNTAWQISGLLRD